MSKCAVFIRGKIRELDSHEISVCHYFCLENKSRKQMKMYICVN